MTKERPNFNSLLEIIETLLGPEGCPWDREQCLHTLHRDLLEETHEVIEAIEEGDGEGIEEELGDLLFLVLFLGKLGERDGVLSMERIVERAREKFVHRHPHVFGEAEVRDAADVLEQWEERKKLEKSQRERKSVLDGIPKGLPALARAQKMAKKMAKLGYAFAGVQGESKEGVIVNRLFDIAQEAMDNEIDAETAFLSHLFLEEKEFRLKEQKPK